MSDTDDKPDILDKYFKQPVDPEAFDEEIEPHKAYGMLRVGGRQALMLDVRHYNGNRWGFSYAYLMGVEFNPSEGIVLRFTSATVTLTGWKLHPVYDGLLRHAVTYVQEGNQRTDQPGDAETFIDAITVLEPG